MIWIILYNSFTLWIENDAEDAIPVAHHHAKSAEIRR